MQCKRHIKLFWYQNYVFSMVRLGKSEAIWKKIHDQKSDWI